LWCETNNLEFPRGCVGREREAGGQFCREPWPACRFAQSGHMTDFLPKGTPLLMTYWPQKTHFPSTPFSPNLNVPAGAARFAGGAAGAAGSAVAVAAGVSAAGAGAASAVAAAGAAAGAAP